MPSNKEIEAAAEEIYQEIGMTEWDDNSPENSEYRESSRKAAKAALEAAEAVKWQPISIDKIENWKDYLLCDYKPEGVDMDGDFADEVYIVYQGYYSPSDGGRDAWLTTHSKVVYPKYFAPLPQPPKEGE